MPKFVFRLSSSARNLQDEDLQDVLQERDGTIKHRGRAALKETEFALVVSVSFVFMFSFRSCFHLSAGCSGRCAR